MELKPCPFCASKNISLLEPDESCRTFVVSCNDCGAEAGYENIDKLAIHRWNTRNYSDIENTKKYLAMAVFGSKK